MKRLLILLVLLLVSCTDVKITDEIKETAVDKVEDKIGITTEDVNNKTTVIKETIGKLTDNTYDTPSVVTKRVLKETAVETFGDVI